MTGPQTDMRPVYGITKALIAPSLWFESWGRVTSEAALNQIPVLCSTSGGLPEAMCGCGVALDTPEHCRNDFYSLPTDEEIRPWVEGLKTILNTDYSEQFKIAQQQLAPETTTRRLLDALSGLLRQRASVSSRCCSSGCDSRCEVAFTSKLCLTEFAGFCYA